MAPGAAGRARDVSAREAGMRDQKDPESLHAIVRIGRCVASRVGRTVSRIRVDAAGSCRPARPLPQGNPDQLNARHGRADH
jgi:hypothetical protein